MPPPRTTTPCTQLPRCQILLDLLTATSVGLLHSWQIILQKKICLRLAGNFKRKLFYQLCLFYICLLHLRHVRSGQDLLCSSYSQLHGRLSGSVTLRSIRRHSIGSGAAADTASDKKYLLGVLFLHWARLTIFLVQKTNNNIRLAAWKNAGKEPARSIPLPDMILSFI